MTLQAARKTLRALNALGFDNARVTRYARGMDGYSVTLGCSQCEALAINGMATHERGCPNARRFERDDTCVLCDEGDTNHEH